jgi:hypothetical protein
MRTQRDEEKKRDADFPLLITGKTSARVGSLLGGVLRLDDTRCQAGRGWLDDGLAGSKD